MDDYQTPRKILSQKHSTIVNSNEYIDLPYINKWFYWFNLYFTVVLFKNIHQSSQNIDAFRNLYTYLPKFRIPKMIPKNWIGRIPIGISYFAEFRSELRCHFRFRRIFRPIRVGTGIRNLQLRGASRYINSLYPCLTSTNRYLRFLKLCWIAIHAIQLDQKYWFKSACQILIFTVGSVLYLKKKGIVNYRSKPFYYTN